MNLLILLLTYFANWFANLAKRLILPPCLSNQSKLVSGDLGEEYSNDECIYIRRDTMAINISDELEINVRPPPDEFKDTLLSNPFSAVEVLKK